MYKALFLYSIADINVGFCFNTFFKLYSIADITVGFCFNAIFLN